MAAQLVTPDELSSWVGQPVPQATAVLFIAAATALIQAETAQSLVQVTGDTVTLEGSTNEWLALPQRPVNAVQSVTMQDANLAPIVLDSQQYMLRGNRLWRYWGWQYATVYLPPVRMLGWRYLTYPPPSLITVVYDHGLAPGHPDLEFARTVAFTLGAGIFANPSGSRSVTVDDYSETYSDAITAMQLPATTKALLRRRYGKPAGSVVPA